MSAKAPMTQAMGDRGSRGLLRLALTFACVFGLLAWFFIAAEAMSDPGGLKGIGLVLSWTVPLIGLALLAWYRPAWATPVLEGLTVAVVAVAMWFAADPGAWRSYENVHGPLRAISVFVLMPPLALLGWRRSSLAGWMLLVVGLVPVLAASTTHLGGFGSTVAIGVPATIDGILYLLADTSTRA